MYTKEYAAWYGAVAENPGNAQKFVETRGGFEKYVGAVVDNTSSMLVTAVTLPGARCFGRGP